MSGFTYLASPYSHPNPEIRLQRYIEACKAAGYLMRRDGTAVFSPIAHSHAIEQFFDHIEPGPFWMLQDIPVLRHASNLTILKLDGWEKSKGIGQEMEIARVVGMPIDYLEPYAVHSERR